LLPVEADARPLRARLEPLARQQSSFLCELGHERAHLFEKVLARKGAGLGLLIAPQHDDVPRRAWLADGIVGRSRRRIGGLAEGLLLLAPTARAFGGVGRKIRHLVDLANLDLALVEG